MQIKKFLHKFGLHFYEDRIKLDHLKATLDSVPFEAREVCVFCDKTRKEVSGTMSLGEL